MPLGTLKQDLAAAIGRKMHADAKPAQRTESRRRPVRQRISRAQRMQELVEATIDVLAKKVMRIHHRRSRQDRRRIDSSSLCTSSQGATILCGPEINGD
jgi:hypothetical protein